MLQEFPARRRTSTPAGGFDRVRISIADPDVIRHEWSHGEVKKPETINHRSFKPERDGLFCAKIFGPVKDYECLCGRYKRMKYKGVVCEKCDVEVTLKKVRRERMGHIELAVPVAHAWFMKSTSANIGLVLGMKFSEVRQVVYFERYIVIDPGTTGLQKLQLLDDEEYDRAVQEYGEGEFRVGMGAEAIRELLSEMNGDALEKVLDDLQTRSESLKRDLRSRKLLGRAARLLDMSVSEINKLISWQSAVVLDPGASLRLKEGKRRTRPITNIAKVGGRYAAQGTIFASGPSAVRDMLQALRRSGEVEADGALFDELVSVLEPFLKEEADRAVADAGDHPDDALELETRQEILSQELGVPAEEFAMLLDGETVLIPHSSGVASRFVSADEAREAGLAVATGLDALRELLAAGKESKSRRDAFAAWMVARLERDLRFSQDSVVALRGEAGNEKELKRLLEDVNKRRRIISKMIESGNRPEWMVLTVLPVIPPDLRPLVQLDGGRFATSDLNELYRRVINRNNRLRKLKEQQAPEIIVRNEKRMLQRSVDALLANGSIGEPSLDANKRPLKSFSDILFGKQGRFRQNLLGKRVDFSGRSVIVVGPELMLHQCGLPKRMALELFRPFIYARLQAQGYSPTIKRSKQMVDEEDPRVWDALAEVVREHPVLLNRAPTLHRLGIQAFEPVLINGKAIQLHPLVCAAFNADFDGDQMAVHIPLSVEAQLEARVLMMSTNNILSPADGKPVIVPSQDIILGLYYLSLMLEGEPGEGMTFPGPAPAEHALFAGRISLHSRIFIRVETHDEGGQRIVKRYETTLGRVRIAKLLPDRPGIRFEFVNRQLRKAEVRQLIDLVYRHCGQKETVVFCDRLMQLGFSSACSAGISVGMRDMVIPDEKQQLVTETRSQIDDLESQYRDNLITMKDKYDRVVEAWTRCTDAVADAVVRRTSVPAQVSLPGSNSEPDMVRQMPNSVYMMMHSGARGSRDQMKQIAGMRGLMSKPSGEIIETPIESNFMEGLTVREYFYSTHGARKGQTDTALKTARSGYLTRRLVYLAHSCVVREQDCGTSAGITIDAVVPGERHSVPFSTRILGRVAQAGVVDEVTGQTLVDAGKLIDERDAAEVEAAGVPRIRVRSPLTCESRDGVCALCYGRDLARGEIVNIGETVGIIAAQSIGEPGTQLTMRTFHSGGAAAVSERASIEAAVDGSFEVRGANIVVDPQGRAVVAGSQARLAILDAYERLQAVESIPYGARILAGEVVEGKASGSVEAGERIAEWDPYNHVIVAERDGRVQFDDLIPKLTYREDRDETSGAIRRIVIDWTGVPGSSQVLAKSKVRLSSLKPSLAIVDDQGEVLAHKDGVEVRSLLSVGAMILVEHGDEVSAGEVIARIPRESATSTDITGGLPRLEALFNVHGSKEGSRAIIARLDGRIRFGLVRGNNRRIIIEPDDPAEEPVEYTVPKDRHISVAEGGFIKKGDFLIDGDPAPQDILDVYGEEEGQQRLARYLIDESHKVYRAQGVEINDKHIEVIVRQMLRKVRIIDPGDTPLLEDERVDRGLLADINQEVIAAGGRPAEGHPVVRRYFDEMRRDTSSFIAEASFVETQRVLTRAAAEGEVDELLGLKENVVVGRLIPAGSGLVSRQILREAARKDREIEEEYAARRRENSRKIEAKREARQAFAPQDSDGAEPLGAENA